MTESQLRQRKNDGEIAPESPVLNTIGQPSGKLASFSGDGESSVERLVDTFRENTQVLWPFINTCAEALAACYPDLYDVDDETGAKFNLMDALANNPDSLKDHASKPAMQGSLSTISQLCDFFVHMKNAGKGMDECDTVYTALTGDKAGLLSAIAIASSATDAELGDNAQKAVRAAFYAGNNPDAVESEWEAKDIKFSPLRLPCVAGEEPRDLRSVEDLNHAVAEILKNAEGAKGQNLDKTAAVAQVSGMMAFGAVETSLSTLKKAIASVAGEELPDWKLEAAGAGGILWENVDSEITPGSEKEKKLVEALRRSPYGLGVADNLVTVYPTPGDLLKHLQSKSSLATDTSRSTWKWEDVNWAMVVIIFGGHLIALYGLYLAWQKPNFWWLLTEVFILYPVTGCLGITAGAHRLWSHRSYQAHFPTRLLFLIANSIANQGTIFHWSRDHRVHHAKSDTAADPHDITRGFFYSHMGWLLLKKSEEVKIAGRTINCDDLIQDPLVWIQHACDPWWNSFFCWILPGLYCQYMYDDFVLGFCFLGFFRWLICLHATWTVNSVAHTFGPRPYTGNMYPSESWFTSLVAVGEGWHNWHHTYPWDYSASELGWLDCFNPTTFVIDALAAVGQVYKRKRAIHRKPKHTT